MQRAEPTLQIGAGTGGNRHHEDCRDIRDSGFQGSGERLAQCVAKRGLAQMFEGQDALGEFFPVDPRGHDREQRVASDIHQGGC